MMNFDTVLFNGWQYIAVALIIINLGSMFVFSSKKILSREGKSRTMRAEIITSVLAWAGAIPLMLSQPHSGYVIIITILIGGVSAAKYLGVAALAGANGSTTLLAPILLFALSHKWAIVSAAVFISIQAGLGLLIA